MDLKKYILIFAFVVSIVSDNLAIKDSVIEQALQFVVLLSFVAFVMIVFLSKPENLLKFINDRLFHAFMALCLVISIVVHGFNAFSVFKVIQYWISGTLIFVCFPSILFLDDRLFKFTLKLILFFTVVLSCSGIAGSLLPFGSLGQIVSQKPFYSILGLIASGGILEHPITLSCQIMIGALIGIYLWLEDRKYIYLVFLSILFLGLISSMGRTGMLGLFVGVVYGLTFLIWRARTMTVFVISAFLIPSSVLFIFFVVNNVDILREYFRIEYGLANREHIWRLSVELIQERPWFGYGMLAAQQELGYYFEVGDFGTKQEIGGAGNHNAFLDMAFNYGLPIMAVYYLIFFRSIYYGYKTNCRPNLKFLLISTSVAVLVSLHFIIFNIGGVRFTSICLVAMLGFSREIGRNAPKL